MDDTNNTSVIIVYGIRGLGANNNSERIARAFHCEFPLHAVYEVAVPEDLIVENGTIIFCSEKPTLAAIQNIGASVYTYEEAMGEVARQGL